MVGAQRLHTDFTAVSGFGPMIWFSDTYWDFESLERADCPSQQHALTSQSTSGVGAGGLLVAALTAACALAHEGIGRTS